MHEDLTGDVVKSLITSFLNPLRVCQPSVVRSFSAITRSYLLVSCNSIIMRDNKTALPTSTNLVMGGKGKQMRLDSFFPFDSYLLEEASGFWEKIYRQYSGDIV